VVQIDSFSTFLSSVDPGVRRVRIGQMGGVADSGSGATARAVLALLKEAPKGKMPWEKLRTAAQVGQREFARVVDELVELGLVTVSGDRDEEIALTSPDRR
jgi:hypothetical protein